MKQDLSPAEQALRDAARDYHRLPSRGKISVTPTKPLSNQRDLSLAYSPGVAYPCLDIQADPSLAAEYTSRGNLVGVITNGTAVLGLGDIGPLAGKPVMEGKGCLFKKFAGIDVFDIELAERDPDKLVDIIAAMEPTLGGINLEDIKAPECFYIERKLRERMNIPVFHDDQHGTAIISAAALLNGLELVGKQISEVKIAVSGAGAAAIACLDVMVGLGAKPANIHACDSKGLIYMGRPGGFDESKARYAQKDSGARSLADVVQDADVFLGCSAPGVLTQDMVKTMAQSPIILALANPEPEIRPELAKAVRPDCIIATGRSDYPNQVNNVLCFPYIFRGALDCGASKITEAMKLACVREIAELAKADISEEVAHAYAGQELAFGTDYIIPKPFDSRLILRIAPAVAKAAAESGVAARPIQDMDAYRQHLTRFVYSTGMLMRPVFSAARAATQAKRVAYAEGEDERVLRAAQLALEDGLAKPILIGRPAVIEARIAKAGLRLALGRDVECVNPEDDPRFRQYWETYHRLMGRRGVSPEASKAAVRRSTTTIGALMVRLGDADAMLCGLHGRFDTHLDHIRDVIGLKAGAPGFATLNALMLPKHTLFIADTFVNEDPSAEQLASIAMMAADEVRRFGLPPKVAFLSHSNYGSSNRASARKMRVARDLFAQMAPDVECDGELHGDAALSEEIRNATLMETTLHGEANILICPNLDAANILFNVLKVTGGQGVTVGPILLGAAATAHVLTPSATVRRVINMTALAVANANAVR
ncbi:NADP-dependent malic enzyme [Ramlibacter sp. 2FC]|uniref:NADP-dependent malic enzyme n=1 Tax=Ramlibacter sp. 2FC TaxID=2502188 RepID=UPI0010F66628|nr:NADP-dependent malic enzyme [Ramlibacter sp. 2FC]